MAWASLLAEMWLCLKARERVWLGPVVAAVVALGAVLVLMETSAVVPFLYALF